ncbi:hypothetical protein [Marinibactrum halimedae]|uniref:Uncharacterized protein n=1 Tax=Marinibactrum halimedae TaxID=1444977 RepID=A0AA37T8Y3_9GAMM|nr:hypothetical protein [Marinibactrum halimedae]MCD9460610.1 hypothetical protein [Marinibactrum halimedae]GLS27826.1 hypothetical protein GCM10007877_35450 [Marinibactrum halimedae]
MKSLTLLYSLFEVSGFYLATDLLQMALAVFVLLMTVFGEVIRRLSFSLFWEGRKVVIEIKLSDRKK